MSENLPLLSVVIPVYNVQDCLRQALDSVTNQSYKNMEIIIINDGSTDNSYEICKEYASRDKRIILLTGQNNGLSTARNIGIKNAHGEYIAFLDSDDWLALDCYQISIKKAQETGADIVAYDIFEVYKKKYSSKTSYIISKK